MKPKRVLFRKRQRDLRAIVALSCVPIIFILYFFILHDNSGDGGLEEFQPKWKLSPLWSEDGQPHVNPHPFR